MNRREVVVKGIKKSKETRSIHIRLGLDAYNSLLAVAQDENRSVSGQAEWIVKRWFRGGRIGLLGTSGDPADVNEQFLKL